MKKENMISIQYNRKETPLANLLYYFILLFLSYTSLNKIMNLDSFQMNLMKTGLFQESAASELSLLVITSEFLVILLLLFNKKAGTAVVTMMITVFTVYIFFLQTNGLYEVCGCGGVLNGLEFKYHLLINLSLITASCYCFIQFIRIRNGQ